MKLKIPLPQCDEELELLTQWYFGKPLHLKTMSENCYEILEDYNSYHGDGFQFSESCTRGYDHSADFWAVVFGPLYCGGIGRASYGQFKANGWRQKRRISKWLKRRSERRSSTPRRAFVRLAAQSSGAERTDRSATRSVLMRGRVDAVRRASFPIALFLILILSGCGMDRRANQPAGDELPAPKRALVLPSQDSQYITEHGQPEAERVSEEEARRAMRAADDFINRKGVIFVLREGKE